MKVQIYDRIEDAPKDLWNRLAASRSLTFAHEFWQIIEKSGLDNFVRPRHVMLFDDGGAPVALTSFYSVDIDVAIFAPPALRRLLAAIRLVWPGFLKLPMLECGTPVTLNSPPVVVPEPRQAPRVLGALDELLMRTARREGQWVVIVRDFEPREEMLGESLTSLGYSWVDGLPNTYLDVAWSSPQQYLASMRSYYRSKVLKHLRRCREAGVRHAFSDDFAALAPTLAAQWRVVHENAVEFQREVLTEEFYRRLAVEFPGRARVLLLYRGAELVGHALMLIDGELMRWLYFGRSAARNDSLYIYAGYHVVEAAIRSGAKRIEMGLTTYPVKQDLGATVTPIRFALRGARWWIHLFVVPVYSLLNRTPKPHERAVFKPGAAPSVPGGESGPRAPRRAAAPRAPCDNVAGTSG